MVHIIPVHFGLSNRISEPLRNWFTRGVPKRNHHFAARGPRRLRSIGATSRHRYPGVADKGLWIGAKIVDDVAWEKVTSGVYKGFSIGGKTLARDKDDRKIITKITLNEISLVDRPSNPEAVFDVWKSAGAPTLDEVFENMSGEDRALTLIKATRRLAGAAR